LLPLAVLFLETHGPFVFLIVLVHFYFLHGIQTYSVLLIVLLDACHIFVLVCCFTLFLFLQKLPIFVWYFAIANCFCFLISCFACF
jgi:hypothetical protein